MARPTQNSIAINRGLFADIYKDCCKNEAECKILDIIIAEFLLKEVFKGSEATERAIAKVTGLSKSGVRVVQSRAMQKMKDSLVKGGIRKVDDVVDSSGRSSVAAKGNDSVDETECNESTKDLRSMTRAEFIDHLDDIAEYLDYVLQGDDYEEREELIDKFGDIIVELKDYKGWAK